MILIFLFHFQVREDIGYLFIRYDGLLNGDIKIFYEIHTEDTIFSDFSFSKKRNFRIKIYGNPEFVLFFFEDMNGKRDPDNKIPYEYVFKGKNLKFVDYLLNQKTIDFEKVFKYLNKEKQELPDNKWVRFFEFRTFKKKGEDYEVFYEDVKDTVLYPALKIIYLISKNKDYRNEIMSFIKRFPHSSYTEDILSVIDLKYIPEILESLKIWKLNIKTIPDLMFYYLINNFSIRDTLFRNKLLELYLNHEFDNSMIKSKIEILMFQFFDWEMTKKYIRFDDIYKMNDPFINSWYIYYLLNKDNDYKNALRLSLKNIDLYKKDFFEKIFWNMSKEYRDLIRKVSLCETYSNIAKSYYGLKNLSKAKKFIELSIENETMDCKADYKLAGDIYYELDILDKAEYYYLLYYTETQDTALFERLKKIYKGENFEKYLADGKKNILRKKMLNIKAEDFELVDISGNKIRLNDLKGKVILINFWATWCGPCRKEIPYLNLIFEKFRSNKDIIFLGITDEEKKDVEDFLKNYEYKFHILLGNIKDKFGVFGIPTTIIIDKNGYIQFRHVGFGDGIGEQFVREISEEIEFLIE